MNSLNDLLRLLRGGSAASSPRPGGPTAPAPSLSPEGLAAARAGSQQALAPRQSDESHLIIRPFGPHGDILQHSEEWTHGQTGLKAVTTEVRVITCTGELAKPTEICVHCPVCGGHDSAVAHCRCGVALCRRCLRSDPVDQSPLCPRCHQVALETFNTWAARDLQQRRSS